MAISLEDNVKRLNAEGRLRWEGALNSVDYYKRQNGFYDGVAACLDALADRFEPVSKETRKAERGDVSAILRNAASELWKLQGDGRNWRQDSDLLRATATEHLLSALLVEYRRTVGEF